MHIRPISLSDASELSHYYLRNAEHLKEWEPARADDFNEIAAWQKRLNSMEKEVEDGKAAHFVGVDEASQKIIGVCSLRNIVYGAFMAAHMGYSIDKEFEGNGYMKNICDHATTYAFSQLNLNRVMANYIPRNKRSGKLLDSLGFSIEGKAKKYLKINGKWEDHILTSLIQSDKI